MTTVLEDLKAARARVARGWCQGKYAADAAGDEVDPDDSDAVAWCLFGAFGGHPGTSLTPAEKVLVRASEVSATWNDRLVRTKAEVLAAFDKAILLAEAESKPGAAAS